LLGTKYFNMLEAIKVRSRTLSSLVAEYHICIGYQTNKFPLPVMPLTAPVLVSVLVPLGVCLDTVQFFFVNHSLPFNHQFMQCTFDENQNSTHYWYGNFADYRTNNAILTL
jgi:hypothetical protein